MLQGLVIFLFVRGKAVLAQDQFRQVERETVGIFEREHIHTADLGLTGFLGVCHQFIEQADTLVEGLEEGLFFGFDNRNNLLLLRLEFRVRLTHVRYQLRNELIKEGLALAQERITVTHRTTEDTTNDISGFLVTR